MNHDTPLAQVAHMLPPESAALLVNLDVRTQQLVLELSRNIIVAWEQSGVDLDPITFSMVITPVVATMGGMITATARSIIEEIQ